jgi:hypothetical protein
MSYYLLFSQGLKTLNDFPVTSALLSMLVVIQVQTLLYDNHSGLHRTTYNIHHVTLVPLHDVFQYTCSSIKLYSNFPISETHIMLSTACITFAFASKSPGRTFLCCVQNLYLRKISINVSKVMMMFFVQAKLDNSQFCLLC